MLTSHRRVELTLDDYLTMLRRRWLWLLVPLVLGGALSAMIGLRAEPKYSATAAVLLADSAAQDALDPTSTNPGLLSRRIENEINSARSDATEELVEEGLGFLPEDVSITGIDSADVLEFTAVAADPQTAASWANIWAQAYVTTKQVEAEASITAAVGQLEERLDRLQAERQDARAPLDQLRDQLATANTDERRAVLQARVERMADDLAPTLSVIDVQIAQVVTSVGDLQLSGEVARSGTARVLQVASPPESDSGEPLARTILAGLALGGVLGLGLVLAAETLDKTIKSSDDVVEATGLPVLGAVPRPAKGSAFDELALVSRDHPGSTVADGYQRVSSAFQFSLVGKDVKSVLVTSANQSEGKTTTSANLAYSLAALDNRVALVDCDFRRPRLHRALGLPMEPGFSNHLIDGTPLEELASYVDGERMLAMIPCGGLPPNPAEFVAMPEFATALSSLEEVADLVILDGPPLLPVADSLSLARRADAVIITAKAGATSKEQLRRALESVRQVGGNVLGVVVIGVKLDVSYGAYQYYAGDEAPSDKRFRRRKRSAESAAPTGIGKASRPQGSRLAEANVPQELAGSASRSEESTVRPVPRPDDLASVARDKKNAS